MNADLNASRTLQAPVQEQAQALVLLSMAGTMAARTRRLGMTAGTQAQVSEADTTLHANPA